MAKAKADKKESATEGRKEKRNAKQEKQEKQEKNREREEKKERSAKQTIMIISIPIIVLFIIFFYAVLPSLSVPFSTFKSNFQHASRVAVFAVYKNQSYSGVVLQCATQTIQVAAHGRNATTIDYYVLNQSACTYPVGGLGHQVSLATNTISTCLNMASSETSIFLNYSSANRTVVTPYKLYVYGNQAYMLQCPIAVDIS